MGSLDGVMVKRIDKFSNLRLNDKIKWSKMCSSLELNCVILQFDYRSLSFISDNPGIRLHYNWMQNVNLNWTRNDSLCFPISATRQFAALKVVVLVMCLFVCRHWRVVIFSDESGGEAEAEAAGGAVAAAAGHRGRGREHHSGCCGQAGWSPAHPLHQLSRSEPFHTPNNPSSVLIPVLALPESAPWTERVNIGECLSIPALFIRTLRLPHQSGRGCTELRGQSEKGSRRLRAWHGGWVGCRTPTTSEPVWHKVAWSINKCLFILKTLN